jgi:murein L,D-transpeptidase YcbB/YkuD
MLRARLGLQPAEASGDSYDARLASAVSEYQTVHGLSQSGRADHETIASLNAGARQYESIIRLNLDRARVLPNPAIQRFVLVDSAGAQLWTVDSFELRDPMRVIVGKPEMATPQLAGFIRFAVTNPYWNVPPDLVRYSIAPKVLQDGIGTLAQRRMEILTGWSPDARTLAPEAVDWAMVAAGGSNVRLRQLPGAGNVMGAVKFMLPNRLGIYLHDTWDKSGFARSDRRLSSGCVRVGDATRLAAWLFEGDPPPLGQGPAEHRVDLPRPVPVYILHLTALPDKGGIRFQKDGYGLDAGLLAADTVGARAETRKPPFRQGALGKMLNSR